MGRAFWSQENLEATCLGGTNYAENIVPVSACCCSKLTAFCLRSTGGSRSAGFAVFPVILGAPQHVHWAPLDAKTLFFPRHPYRCSEPTAGLAMIIIFQTFVSALVYNFVGLASEIPLTPLV